MEKRNSVDQRRLAVGTFLAAHAANIARQGTIVQTWRRRGRRRLGPYYRLVCRDEAGRQRSVYLGPSGPIVDEARDALRRLQSPRRQQREIEGARQALRRELAKSRLALDAELAKIGLQRKGSEIRGWSRGAVAARAANGRPSPSLPSGGMTMAVVGRGASGSKGPFRRAAATECT
jgi:hypothetical protein